MVKRLFDIVFVVLMVWLWLPILAVTALVVLLVDGRPIFFLQQRAGRGGVPFSVIKFKTMLSRDGGEPVPTRLGQWLRRLSLDEVPQLLNVLMGDMSLIGPRPLLVQYLPIYTPEQARRHEVRPGITGWAQVHGRNAISWHEKFYLDVWYVDHCFFRTDLEIVGLTIVNVLKRKDINSATAATMEAFDGTN